MELRRRKRKALEDVASMERRELEAQMKQKDTEESGPRLKAARHIESLRLITGAAITHPLFKMLGVKG
ncbi:hypothetical protein WJX75_001358 [Coccomyxa subellipsoidea]|uniref:Uncharacterized protein n=1 Tax=Coccomyxa subellipsoidea TaxID=248742 RepID=A0ABR2YXC8_9CHLO